MRERLQKILAAGGIASRRGAEKLIRAGRVRVNGEVAELGASADAARDAIEVDGVPVVREEPAYWLLHKPRGVLSTCHDPEGRRTVLDLLPREAGGKRLFPVGRLDRDSEGLLLLTNDGAVAQVLLHPSRGTERTYRVTVRGRLSEDAKRALAAGVVLADGRTAPARVARVRWQADRGTTQLELVLREGRKRQIRRSLEKLGHPVTRLVRTKMGPLELAGLARGSARRLAARERAALLRFVKAREGEAASASPSAEGS